MPRAGPDLELAVLGFDFPVRDGLFQLVRVDLQLFRHLLPRHAVFHARSSQRLTDQSHHGPEFVCASRVPGRQPTRRQSGVGDPLGDELLGPLRVGPDRAVRGRFAAKVGVDEGLVRGEGAGLVVDVEVEELGEQEGAEAALDDLRVQNFFRSEPTRVPFTSFWRVPRGPERLMNGKRGGARETHAQVVVKLGGQLLVACDERVGDHEREGRVRLRERERARLELRDELAVWWVKTGVRPVSRR